MTAGTTAKAGPVSAKRAIAALPRSGPKVAAWFAAIALYAAAVAVFSGPGHDRVWATWAAGAYAASALAALLWRSRGTDAALLLSLAGAVIAPVIWLLTLGPAAPETTVLGRAGTMLLHHGTPYFSPGQLAIAHQAFTVYNPYLPVMTVFGLPNALRLPSALGSPTWWLVAVTAALFLLAFRIAGRPDPARTTALAITSPMIAFPLSVTITDPPIVALICLILALLGTPGGFRGVAPPDRHRGGFRGVAPQYRHRGGFWGVAPQYRHRASRTPPIVPAAIIMGVACAMKTTAWPALPVIAAMLATRDGARAAIRFSAVTAVTTATLFVAFAPALLVRPADLVQNTVLYPLGLTHIATPAASPVPGHLLANAGPAGHLAAVVLLIVTGVAVAAWIIIRPPTDVRAATWRLAVGLTLIFALDPEARFGYFDYPLGLCGWIALCYGVPAWRARHHGAGPADPLLAPPPPAPGGAPPAD